MKNMKYEAPPFKLRVIIFDQKHRHGREIFKTEFSFTEFISNGFRELSIPPKSSKSSDCRFKVNMSVVQTKGANDDISSISMGQLYSTNHDSDGLSGISGAQIKQSYAFVSKFTGPGQRD